MSSEKKITLKSSDGKTFEVEETAALESQTIKHMVEDDCANDEIPLPNVTSTILSKVIEYCKKHAEARSGESTEDDLRTWDADFVKVDQDTLFDLILAANYLEIKSLLDLTCQTVADMIKGKTPEELRKIFNLEEPSPEEEEEIRKENPWAFDTIILKSSDGTRFKVGYEVALMSQTIKRMVVDDEDKTVVVPQLNVTSTILAKVIEYCKKHVETRSTEDDLRNWDADFIKVDRGTLYDLMTAANYLNIKSLQHLTFLTYVGVSQRKD